MLRNPINKETGVRVKEIIEIPEFELSNGVKIPALGMGTFPIGNKRIPMVMREAKKNWLHSFRHLFLVWQRAGSWPITRQT